MTISYELSPIPKWYIADKTGKPLAGGSMYTYSNTNRTMLKFVFQDPDGILPWTDPVLFDETGSQGPFYWQVNSADSNDTYFIEVYDSNGLLQWSIEDYIPPGGGGGSVTEVVSLDNLIVNNVMYRNIGASANPINSTLLKLSLGAHDGLSNNVTNVAGLYTGPDIYFVKNNTNANDQLQFLPFTLGSTSLNGDETPYEYLNYSCGNSPAGETTKCVQFPITRRVQNLNNVQVTLTIWARCNSGTSTLTLSWFQFFGDGAGATAPITTLIQTLTLTGLWQQFSVTATVPGVAGKNLGSMGACGNDGLFLQIGYPLGEATNIDFTKPCLYLGQNFPAAQYTTYDMINAVISSPRTGYAYAGYDTVAPFGYLMMDDGTIGSASSGATSNSGRGASVNSFALYCLLWNNVSSPTTNFYAPVTGGLGANAVADFIANKTMQLTRALGRVLAGSGQGSGLSNFALGQFGGEETHVLTIPEMPAHSHTPANVAFPFLTANGGAGNFGAEGANNATKQNTTDTVGGSAAHNNIQPTSYVNYFIKL